MLHSLSRAPAPRLVMAGLCVSALMVGCGLFLDDPQAFNAKELKVDAAIIDAAPPRDIPDLPDTQGCIPEPEICDGYDNDCDTLIDAEDEDLEGECAYCLVEGGVGRCVVGGRICFNGRLECAWWLPEGGPSAPCDLLDNNCDGRIDEEGEYTPLRTRAQQTLVERCGPGPERWEPEAEGDCDTESPRRVGCGPAHPCYEPDCVTLAHQARDAGEASCLATCRGEAEEAACVVPCRAEIFAAFIEALSACPTQGASRWSCVNSVTGPACEVIE